MRLRRRHHLLAAIRGILVLACLASILLLMGSGIDPLTELLSFPLGRTLYAYLALLSLGLALGLAFYEQIRAPTAKELALLIEQQRPEAKNNVINSLQLYPYLKPGAGNHGFSSTLIAALVRLTARQLQTVHPAAILDGTPLHGWSLAFLLLGGMITVAALIHPEQLRASVQTILSPWEKATVPLPVVEVEPRDRIVVKGSPVEIRARVKSGHLARLNLHLSSPPGREEVVVMGGSGNGVFSHTIPQVERPLHYRVSAAPYRSPTYRIDVVEPLQVGNIQVRYLYPEYTQLQPTVETGTGHIRGIKGTEVQIETQVNRPIVKGEMRLTGAGVVPLKIKGGNRLHGTLVLVNTDSYEIAVADRYGFANRDTVRHAIEVIPDAYPQVEITEPKGDLIDFQDEVLSITYQVRDDYGISSLTLIYRTPSRQGKIIITKPGGLRKSDGGAYRWNLASTGLLAGEQLEYYLEVADNDLISGPKVAVSKSHTLLLKGTREERQRMREMVKGIGEALADLLADHLEKQEGTNRPGQSPELSRRLGQIGELARETQNLIDREGLRDMATSFDLDLLRRNLANLRQRLGPYQGQWPARRSPAPPPPPPAEEITTELERLALFAQNIGQRAQLEEFNRVGEELLGRQQRLLDTLEKLGRQPGKEELQAALKEVGRLQELLEQMMRSLSQLAAQLPQEFFNSQSLQGLPLGDMLKELETIRQRLQAGDLAGALQAAREMLRSLAMVMASLRNAQMTAQQSLFNRLQQQIGGQRTELDEIVREQEEVLRQTEGLDRGVQARLQALLQEVRRRSDQEGGRLEAPLPFPQELLNGQERQELKGLATRQGTLRQRTENFVNRLQELLFLLPFVDPKLAQDIAEALPPMASAKEQLERLQADQAIPPERQALEKLSQSMEGMQQALQQMATRMQIGPLGIPLFVEGQPIPFTEERPLPPFFRSEGGRQGLNTDDFSLPSKEHYQPPPFYREEIVRAMKESFPPQYRERIERYYRDITQ